MHVKIRKLTEFNTVNFYIKSLYYIVTHVIISKYIQCNHTDVIIDVFSFLWVDGLIVVVLVLLEQLA